MHANKATLGKSASFLATFNTITSSLPQALSVSQRRAASRLLAFTNSSTISELLKANRRFCDESPAATRSADHVPAPLYSESNGVATGRRRRGTVWLRPG